MSKTPVVSFLLVIATILIFGALVGTTQDSKILDSKTTELSEVLSLKRQILLKDIEILQLRFAQMQSEINIRIVEFQSKVLKETNSLTGTTYNVVTGEFSFKEEL